MNLTRHNYEEYFLLYVDNELGEEERQWVEQFTGENPDLAEELQALRETVLDREEVFSFGDKGLLYKEEITGNKSGSRQVIPLWKKVLPAAAAILLVGAGAFWLRQETLSRVTSIQPANANTASAPPPAEVKGAADTGGQAAKQHIAGQAGTGTSSSTVRTNPSRSAAGATVSLSATAAGNPATDRNAATPPPATLSGIAGIASGGANNPGGQGAEPPVAATPLIHPEDGPVASGIAPPRQLQPDAEKPDTENKSAPVTIARTVSYHTLEDADPKDDGNKILFVRADQVINGGIKGFFRKAGRLLKHSASLNSENIHPETD